MNSPETVIEHVLDFLSAHKIRATYTAVGEAIGVDRTEVGDYLGDRRPRASWVVLASNGKPSKYNPSEMDPCLFDNDHVIESGNELIGLMRSSQFPYQ